MAHPIPMLYHELQDYIFHGRTPGTKKFDHYFKSPPGTLPSELEKMLREKSWADVSASETDTADLAGLIDNAEEAQNIMTYPAEELADAWAALEYYCRAQGVRAEFFGRFSGEISQKKVEVHLELKVGDTVPSKLEVTFLEPLDSARFKILLEE